MHFTHRKVGSRSTRRPRTRDARVSIQAAHVHREKWEKSVAASSGQAREVHEGHQYDISGGVCPLRDSFEWTGWRTQREQEARETEHE